MTHLQLVRGDTVVNVATGETVDLAAAQLDAFAQARDAFGKFRAEIDDANRLIDAEIARRFDLDNVRAGTQNGWGVEVNAPSTTEWDVPNLRSAITELIADGRLGITVLDRAVPAVTTYKPSARELRKLLEHDDREVRELVRECRRMVPQRRRVTVTAPDSTEARAMSIGSSPHTPRKQEPLRQSSGCGSSISARVKNRKQLRITDCSSGDGSGSPVVILDAAGATGVSNFQLVCIERNQAAFTNYRPDSAVPNDGSTTSPTTGHNCTTAIAPMSSERCPTASIPNSSITTRTARTSGRSTLSPTAGGDQMFSFTSPRRAPSATAANDSTAHTNGSVNGTAPFGSTGPRITPPVGTGRSSSPPTTSRCWASSRGPRTSTTSRPPRAATGSTWSAPPSKSARTAIK